MSSVDVFLWIKRVIQSCVTLSQLKNAYKLIILYVKHFSFDYNYHLLTDCYIKKLEQLS